MSIKAEQHWCYTCQKYHAIGQVDCPAVIEEFEKQLANQLFVDSWIKMRNYLRDNSHRNNIREFRIAFQDNDHFIVHPLNKDGETIDMTLSGLPLDSNKSTTNKQE